MKTNIGSIILIIALAMVMPGCSSSGIDPLTPDASDRDNTISSSRQLWGLWNVEVIPDGYNSADVVFTPLRTQQMHLNVVGLMESGSSAPAVGIEPPVTFSNGVLDVDIKMTHPFGNAKFTGFDVRGIMIGHGSYGGFSEGLFYSGPTDMELINADGHTRLWNPTDYTDKGYVDGKLGTPDAIANFTATLNGYKYFCDALTPNMEIGDMLKSDRGAFKPGSTNIRHYSIRLGISGLVFQYAIDANWWAPAEPYNVPDDFDVERANCPEPYHIETWIGPGITGYGGSADIQIDVYDWQKDVEEVYIEIPLFFTEIMTLDSPEDLGDFVRFTGTITNDDLPTAEFADVLIYATGTDPESAKVFKDYRLYHLPLARVPDGGVIITVQDDMAYKTIGVVYEYGGTTYDYSTGPPCPVDYTDTDGIWDFTSIAPDELGTRGALAKTDPEVAGFAGEFSPNVTHFFKTKFGLGDTTLDIYQAEAHNEGANLLRMWGFYSAEPIIEDINSLPLDPPLDFVYPMDINTNYTVQETYPIVPVLLTLKIGFTTVSTGEGVAIVPVQPGVYGWGWDAQAVLLTRTIATFETGGVLGQGPLGSGLLYQWIADDGTLYGSILTGNDPDSDPNFDESTFEITGSASGNVLREIM